MTETFQKNPAQERWRILVVEDSDLLKGMFLRSFPAAHAVHVASGAQEGWKLYLAIKPHIIFLDIGLPDGNGNDLAAMIKEHDATAYIVMVTANHDKANKEEALRNRVDGFIAKPFSKKELNDCVDRFTSIQREKRRKK